MTCTYWQNVRIMTGFYRGYGGRVIASAPFGLLYKVAIPLPSKYTDSKWCWRWNLEPMEPSE
jgi:hypothetical protein